MRLGGRRPPPSPDLELIRRLAALLAETGLTEIEYAIGDRRIRVSRGAVAASAAAPSDPPPVAAAALGEQPGAVNAPMVGTAYLAAQPGDPPFVRLGDAVVEGQPLMIIEAMKVMNEIRAPCPGRVARILVADAQPVEYGAPLMLIE